MLVPPTTPERQHEIDHAGRINKISFRGAQWTLCGLATMAVIIRLSLRLKARHKLSWDDYLVLFAALTAIAMNITMQVFDDTLYLIEAINIDGLVPTPNEREPLMNGVMWRHIVLSLSWTAICTIKFSFLVFFRNLVRGVSRHITRYYWVTVGVVFVCYGFCVSQSFILCPYFGSERRKCFPDSPRATSIAANTVAASLDIVSDLMIVSIPIMVLRRAKMGTKQKATIAVFLCLSLTMVVFALARVAGAIYPSRRNKYDFDTTWQAFWQHAETNLAVFMGAVMMMRSIFVTALAESNKGSSKPAYGLSHGGSRSRKSWMWGSRNRHSLEDGNEDKVMELRRASSRRASAQSSKSLVSKHDSSSVWIHQSTIPEVPPETWDDDYHSFIRQDRHQTTSSQWKFDFNSKNVEEDETPGKVVDNRGYLGSNFQGDASGPIYRSNSPVSPISAF